MIPQNSFFFYMSLCDLNSSVSVACVACKFYDSDCVQIFILKTNIPPKTNEIVTSLREEGKVDITVKLRFEPGFCSIIVGCRISKNIALRLLMGELLSNMSMFFLPTVQLPRSTIGAEVFIWNGLVIVALDMLPCITLLAQNCVSIIVRICAYTFDGVVFFILTIGIGQRTVNERLDLVEGTPLVSSLL
jgi:hypothetical protein